MPSARSDRASGGLGPSLVFSFRRIVNLEVAGLGSSERGEQCAVRLDVEERRAVEAIEAADIDCAALDAFELHDRSADRVGADGRANGENAARRAVAFRALQDEVSPRMIKPIEDFQPRV